LADLGASITTAEPNELQKVLEAFDVEERLSLTLSLLHKEIEILKLQRDISKQVEAKMTKVKYSLFFLIIYFFLFFNNYHTSNDNCSNKENTYCTSN